MANTKIPVELSSTPGIVDNSNATAITIDSSENVGIKEGSPSATLHTNSGTGNIGIHQESTDSGSYISFSDNSTTSISHVLLGAVANDLVFNAGDAERLRIDSSGLVGIGNTVAATLHAVSTVSNLVVGTGSGNNGIGVYSGTSNLGAITFADGTSGNATYRGGITYNHSTDHLELNGNGGTAHVIVHASGVTSIPNGVELGSGVDATVANTLDDYEEGSWTPAAGGWTGTYSTQEGYYTKVGNIVTAWYEITANGGTGSFSQTYLLLFGLPFAITQPTNFNNINGHWNLLSTGNTGNPNSGVWDGTFPNYFTDTGSSDGVANYTTNMISTSNNWQMRGTLTYRTSA